VSQEDRGALGFEEGRELPLVDHHVHGALGSRSTARGSSEDHRVRSRAGAGDVGVRLQVGFAIRDGARGARPRRMPTRTVYRRAAALGPRRRTGGLGPSGVSHYLDDTGFTTDDLL
jgi:hypothetical protein